MTFLSLVGINFLLGTTWVFVAFYLIFNTGTIATVLWTFSVLCISLQGFFIFFFFVVLNADARKAWKRLLCSCKKKAKPITNNKYVVKGSNGRGVGTLSTALPSYQSATLRENTEKCCKQAQEMLPINKLSPTKDDEKESSPDVMGPTIECIYMKTFLKEEPEDVKEDEEKGIILLRRVRQQSSKKVSHDIEKVELDFEQSSDEHLNKEDS